jgi:phospholipase A2
MKRLATRQTMATVPVSATSSSRFNAVVAAFPEAIGDVSIIQPALKVEAMITKDFGTRQDLYPQIYDGKIILDRPEEVVDSYSHTVTNPPAPPCLHESTKIYMSRLPNEGAVQDFDPSTAKFSGSYNLVWTPEQVEMLINVCLANFAASSEDTIKTVLRKAWLKKKTQREGN